jgi:guanosine-3',5'-bis(diphosphate) 3'-pyrophosphohydrolase
MKGERKNRRGLMEKLKLPDITQFIDLDRFVESEVQLIKRAYAFAVHAHRDQKRLSGEPYIIHPLHVSKILFEMGFDAKVIVAALLHDTVEDTGTTLTSIKSEFDGEIADLVDGVTKISRIRSENIKQRQAENIRKMLFSMVNDIRVILIKLADKLHNMRTLEFMDRENAQRIARETLDIYAPLAGRLGMARVKVELEDLSLKHLDPEFYNDLKNYITESKDKRERHIENVKRILKDQFAQYGIQARIMGRAKHFYSIYKKMKDKDKNYAEIFDLFAIRIIAASMKECYVILGLVHKLWMPLGGRFKDYVAMPKSNMYQSLHTTVIGPEGKPLEVQIRTEKMNIIAEEGISAHWAYKEGKSDLSSIEKELTWLKKLKLWKEYINNPLGFMEDLQKDLLEDEIYVFTPKGDVIDLPVGSTPIDFAFKIHTEIGHHCFGAKVNDRIVPLRKPLHSCDVVEILTAKNTTPSQEWLDVVKTSRARHKIRAYFSNPEPKTKQKEQEKHTSVQEEKPSETFQREEKPVQRLSPGSEYNLIAEGERNIQIHLAQCCNPHPGDDIVGYITRGKGITVHRVNCKNLKAIRDYEKRKIVVEWESKSRKVFNLEIVARDRTGLLMDITTAIANSNANIVELHSKTNRDGRVKSTLRIQIQEDQQLKFFIKDLKSIPEIISIEYH